MLPKMDLFRFSGPLCLIQKNKPGGNEFWAQKSSTILHYWLTFRMESGKLISFSIHALIGLLISFRKIWIVNKCYFVLYWQWIKNLAIWLVFVISMYVLVSHHSSYFVNSIYVFRSMNCEIIWKKPRAILRYIHI